MAVFDTLTGSIPVFDIICDVRGDRPMYFLAAGLEV
jgi:hypothetical protein